MNQRCVDRTDAVNFDAGLCIWNEVRSWSLKAPPYSAYHATRGSLFKGSGFWRFVKAYDRKACTNKAMWEKRKMGQIKPSVTVITCLNYSAQWECQNLQGSFARVRTHSQSALEWFGIFGENICTRIKLFPFSLLFVPVMWSNHTAWKYDQGNKMEKSGWTK